MHEVTTEIEIAAAPQRVWSTLADFPAYPKWNPFIRSIEGVPAPGERLKVEIQPPGGKGMIFRPTVLIAEPGRELRWRGRLLLPGIFDGEHYFRIDLIGPNKVKFTHGERFSGVLVPLVKSTLERGTRAGFVAMNEALRLRVENG